MESTHLRDEKIHPKQFSDFFPPAKVSSWLVADPGRDPNA